MASHTHLTRDQRHDEHVGPSDVEALRLAARTIRPESALRDVLDSLLLSLCASASGAPGDVVVDITRQCNHHQNGA